MCAAHVPDEHCAGGGVGLQGCETRAAGPWGWWASHSLSPAALGGR